MATPLDPLEIYHRGLADFDSLVGVERLLFMLQDFDNLMEMEGWDHFFLYEHHFAWYAEMKHWLHEIGGVTSLALLNDYEAHLAANGVELSPDALEGFFESKDDVYFQNCPDWCGQYCELREDRWARASAYLETQGLRLSMP